MSAKVGILVENVKEVCVGFDDKMLSCKPDLNPAQKLNFHPTTKTKEKWFNFFWIALWGIGGQRELPLLH